MSGQGTDSDRHRHAAGGGRPARPGDPRPSDMEVERLELQQRISRALDIPLAVLALIWTGLLVVELAVALPPALSIRIYQVDIAIWVVFALDFAVEFALAPRKLDYLKSNFLGALSLVLPFFGFFRLFRAAVLLRSISLARIVLVANRSTRAAGEILSEHRFQYVLALVTITTLLGAAGVYFFEREVPNTAYFSFGEALWWAAAMATTINTNIEPVTLEGRVIGMLLRAIALAVFGYITASIASFLVEQRVARREGRAATRERQKSEQEALDRLIHEVEQLRGEIVRLQTHQRETEGEADDLEGR